ncbi:phosphate ABC transporter permease subunit PstC [Acuticoccus sp. MNP-M23]|uniref:phosphate ABC transporter permease subunit PstC n=1 Tax=Acuticoccus sp. MNP-M23 TaxID=3072793 RepID=UPI002815A291|nr:phosphate ABC transporter permease subunit PstC [Acuticoccus sp. MNP-M23]WMS44206.1 phosphate ABC transporter permease subunit PstC [Acuticoccus sp. MNP-M23]
MSSFIPVAVVLILLGIAYQWGVSTSRKVATASSGPMHSRFGYHGLLVALWCLIPAAVTFIIYLVFEPIISDAILQSYLPPEIAADTGESANALSRMANIASGFGAVGELTGYEKAGAAALERFHAIAWFAAITIAAALGAAGAAVARKKISPGLRARNRVELAIRVVLITCSAIAVLTTVGIVLSVLSEALRFFSYVNPMDFLFGTTWNPRFSSTGTGGQGDFGLLPLLWGTIMITIIAMMVAVPVGLMSAIYLSEYAGPKFRFFAKPALEILAGIPTIVYGIFAIFTVGPLFASVGDAIGINIMATSAFTAGVVMGIMIIPFVSSLSDDIISQVPKAMRDGSYGLGATQSETIRKVLLPAALPGIVGAFLLAISRAIGETMIVVLAAGNSPVLTGNPFEAVSTVTVTIVNQLTGDTDFASPQSLVAFALGLTLFIITLILNVMAIYIVRKYREQYE